MRMMFSLSRYTKSQLCRAMLCAALAGTTGFALPTSAAASDAPSETAKERAEFDCLHWHTDYGQAVSAAKAGSRMLFIFFHATGDDANRDAFEQRVLADPDIQRQLADYELLRLPLDAQIVVDGKRVRLLHHPAFEHMHRRQGVAVMDLANEGAAYYHHVVSAFPFKPGTYYPKRKVDAILGLPPGTITQRTLIYAVRTHPDAPQSTAGAINPVLVKAAEKHSIHQASIRLQGHHNWDARFQQLGAQLPSEVLPVEVAAESWPGETLVEAAEECVDCWRQSSGHWRAVRGRHPWFGYDMKRGSNGIWYATGIFGKRR